MHKCPQNRRDVGRGKHSQNMFLWLYVTGKFVIKPLSYVAALHLVSNEMNQMRLNFAKVIGSLRPL